MPSLASLLSVAGEVFVGCTNSLFQFHFEGETRRRRAKDAGSAISTTRSERGSQRSVADEMELELIPNDQHAVHLHQRTARQRGHAHCGACRIGLAEIDRKSVV